ncbi:MAG: adenylyltransferase/cytidyltransferase family protein [Nitrososphaerales archaeon]
MQELYKQLIIKIYLNSLLGKKSTVKELAKDLNLEENHVRKLCDLMKEKDLILELNNEFKLTNLGRSNIKVVFTGGVFDVIHPGHVFTLSSAKSLGDVLVVVIARDKTVLKNKGRNPFNSEEQRLELVKSLKFVDAAILGSEANIFESVIKVKPDIIALGYDQKYDELELEKEAKKHDLSIKFVRLGTKMPDIKTSKIIGNKKIIDEF